MRHPDMIDPNPRLRFREKDFVDLKALELGGLDLNSLTALRALLEEGNLTYAGAKIGVAQSGMSTLLGRFRRHFSDELLVRVGRDYELTPLARELLPSVQEAVRRVNDVLRVSTVFDPAISDRVFTMVVSDYALTVLMPPLLARLELVAPRIQIAVEDPPDDLVNSPRALLRQDFVVGPMGSGITGERAFLFRDRLVCVVAADNPFLVAGGLDLDALKRMPHAVVGFGDRVLTPVDQVLDQRGVTRRVAVRTLGWLPLPFALAGTDIVAILPERLARRFRADHRLVVVDSPFGPVELLETAWWHPSQANDEGHEWLLAQLQYVAAELEDPPAQTSGDR